GYVEFGGERYDVGDNEVEILPPSNPTKIVCIGLNYADHAEETGSEVPDRPLLFLKPPNAVAGHGDTVTLPAGKERVDYEAELGVVIDSQCRNVSREGAMDVVKGFTCINDISNRDDQREEQNWVRGKAFDNAAPFGPVVAEPQHVPEDASIEMRVNGEVKQESSRDEFIFSVPELIEEGDVISTGTPAGVGPLEDGDKVEVEVEGVGTLEHEVRVA
ncbi:MAG: fumarylacetoacetate hydrolase family protein, partial [Halobacteria archaeon]|nr:fumarylacetoacetate hydrolase family protein [Halobacteria archaeon]